MTSDGLLVQTLSVLRCTATQWPGTGGVRLGFEYVSLSRPCGALQGCGGCTGLELALPGPEHGGMFPEPEARLAPGDSLLCTAVQEERQRGKDRNENEVESTSSANEDMPVEKILEAELAVEPKTETYVEANMGLNPSSVSLKMSACLSFPLVAYLLTLCLNSQ